MAEFFVSFKDISDPENPVTSVVLTSDCTKIMITDQSAYSAGESGHSPSDFSDYLRIIIENSQGTQYVYTSIDDGSGNPLNGDELINPPSVVANINVSYLIDSGDGVYKIKICSVPTYNASASYQENTDVVYYSGKLYVSLISNSGDQPDTNPLSWKETTEAELALKYCDFVKIIITCSLLKCIDDEVINSFCAIDASACNDDLLCKNPSFLKHLQLIVIRDSLANVNQRGAYDEAVYMISYSKTLCKCC